MEAWEQKIVADGVDYIKNKLPEDQAYLEQLIAIGPAISLNDEIRKVSEASSKNNVCFHTLTRMIDVLQEHVTTADTSKSQILETAIHRLHDYPTALLTEGDVNFARAQAKGEMETERSLVIEALEVVAWHNKLLRFLSYTINLRHFFNQHLSDFATPAPLKKKKSAMHY